MSPFPVPIYTQGHTHISRTQWSLHAYWEILMALTQVLIHLGRDILHYLLFLKLINCAILVLCCIRCQIFITHSLLYWFYLELLKEIVNVLISFEYYSCRLIYLWLNGRILTFSSHIFYLFLLSLQNWMKGETWKFYLFKDTYVKNTLIYIIPLNLKECSLSKGIKSS